MACDWIFVVPKPTSGAHRERDCIRLSPTHPGGMYVQLWQDKGPGLETHEVVDLSASGLCLRGETQLTGSEMGSIRVYLARSSGEGRELAKGVFEVKRTWRTSPAGLAVQLSEMSESWSRSVPKNWRSA